MSVIEEGLTSGSLASAADVDTHEDDGELGGAALDEGDSQFHTSPSSDGHGTGPASLDAERSADPVDPEDGGAPSVCDYPVAGGQPGDELYVFEPENNWELEIAIDQLFVPKRDGVSPAAGPHVLGKVFADRGEKRAGDAAQETAIHWTALKFSFLTVHNPIIQMLGSQSTDSRAEIRARLDFDPITMDRWLAEGITLLTGRITVEDGAGNMQEALIILRITYKPSELGARLTESKPDGQGSDPPADEKIALLGFLKGRSVCNPRLKGIEKGNAQVSASWSHSSPPRVQVIRYRSIGRERDSTE